MYRKCCWFFCLELRTKFLPGVITHFVVLQTVIIWSWNEKCIIRYCSCSDEILFWSCYEKHYICIPVEILIIFHFTASLVKSTAFTFYAVKSQQASSFMSSCKITYECQGHSMSIVEDRKKSDFKSATIVNYVWIWQSSSVRHKKFLWYLWPSINNEIILLPLVWSVVHTCLSVVKT